jgi:hypothetical protein
MIMLKFYKSLSLLATAILMLSPACAPAKQSGDPVAKWNSVKDKLIQADMKLEPEKLIEQLESKDADARIAAYQATMERGMEMFSVMLNSSWRDKYRAWDAFRDLSKKLGAEVVPVCIETLEKSDLKGVKDNPDESLKQMIPGWNAVEALAKIGPDAKDAVPVLLNKLEKPYTYLVLNSDIPTALESIGDGSDEVINALLKVLDDKDAYMSYDSACYALGGLAKPENKVVIDRLIAFRDKSQSGPVPFMNNVIAARCALYRLGYQPDDNLENIIVIASSKGTSMAEGESVNPDGQAAWDALAKIGGLRAIQALSDVILKSDDLAKTIAVEDLAKLGSTPEVLDILIKGLGLSDESIVYESAHVLKQFGSSASSALPALQMAYTKDYTEHPEIKSEIEEAIIRISEGIPN